jgi:hypothetical protein
MCTGLAAQDVLAAMVWPSPSPNGAIAARFWTSSISRNSLWRLK